MPALPVAVGVAVMAKAPVPGTCKTRLCPPLLPVQAAALHAAMLTDTLVQLEACPQVTTVLMAAPEHDGLAQLRTMFPRLPVEAQDGADLGARMQHAAATLWQRGCRWAVLLGTDAPHAPLAESMARIATLGDRNALVMGPATDGGYWLLALTQPAPWAFADMPWSTAEVAARTRQRCQDAGFALVELSLCTDVDDVTGLTALMANAMAPALVHTRAVTARTDFLEALGR